MLQLNRTWTNNKNFWYDLYTIFFMLCASTFKLWTCWLDYKLAEIQNMKSFYWILGGAPVVFHHWMPRSAAWAPDLHP